MVFGALVTHAYGTLEQLHNICQIHLQMKIIYVENNISCA